MLNLDTEDWGEIFIGCAGGGDSLLTLPLEQEACSLEGQQPLQLSITGLMGGHSGLNIGEGRGNAILMAVGVCCPFVFQFFGTQFERHEGTASQWGGPGQGHPHGCPGVLPFALECLSTWSGI